MKQHASAVAVAFAIAFVIAFVSGLLQNGMAASAGGLPPGVKFCPAPGADNTVFLDTHFGIDAKTGKMTKYTGTVHPDETGDLSAPTEQVLYVAPPISVENKFVPPPGWEGPPPAAPQPQRQRVARQPVRNRQPAPVARQEPEHRPTSQQAYGNQAQAPSRPAAEVAANNAPARRAPAAAPRVSDSGRAGHGKKLPWWKAIWRN